MSTKLYVSNLPYSLTDETLGQLFGDMGTVMSAKIITDRDSGRSKGFGFVEMSTPEEAANAIKKINGLDVNGRLISVAEARPQKPRENNGRSFSRDRRNFDHVA